MKKKKKVNKDNKTSLIKTLKVQHRFSKNELSIIKFMSKISKNVFNVTVFCHSIFEKYKSSIYEELYNFIINNEIQSYSLNIDSQLQKIYEKYYLHYCETKDDVSNNNQIIYEYIIEKIEKHKIVINNHNYDKFKNTVTKMLSKNKKLKFNNNNKFELFTSIIDRIIKSIYIKHFCKTKYEILNKIPISIKDNELIKNVMDNDFLFKKNTNIKKENYKLKIEEIFENHERINHTKDSEEENSKIKEFKYEKKLKSNRNYITRFVYRHIGDNDGLLPSDLIINIISKAFESINSYYAIKEKGLKCNLVKFLPKNSLFILPFFDRSRKEIILDNKNKIRLTLGNHIAKNILEITNDETLICVNNDQKNIYKKYIKKSLLKKFKNGKIKKGGNFVVNNDKHVKYIEKDSEHILNAYYLNITKPEKLNKNNIKINLVEIVPMYDGHSFEIHYKYTETIVKPTVVINDGTKIDDYVSVDLGICNLMTIYDPSGMQHIISGRYLLKLNNKYNYLIDDLKSKAKKKNNKLTTILIRKMLINRDNKINNYFNLIVKWITNMYSNKKIIVGYNLNWKKGVNMGKKNNRTFYQIPYCRLLNKLKFRMSSIGSEMILNEESYTSKCDALSLEHVKKQEKYMGTRKTRGLFSSSKHKYINADLNGAINIMRKYLLKNEILMEKIKGKSIFNPLRINIFREVPKQSLSKHCGNKTSGSSYSNKIFD